MGVSARQARDAGCELELSCEVPFRDGLDVWSQMGPKGPLRPELAAARLLTASDEANRHDTIACGRSGLLVLRCTSWLYGQ